MPVAGVRSSHNSCQQMARGLGARRTRTSRRQSDDHQQERGLSPRRRRRVKRKTLKTYGFVETRSTRSRAASPRRRSDAASSPRRACASSTRRSVGPRRV